MRMQDTAANCGPASLSNALAALGLAHSQAECAQMCKTTATDGTSPKGLMAGMKAVGRQPKVLNERKGATAALWLDHFLRAGLPVVLCVDQGEHWVAAVGILGERVLVADPADNELVLTYTRSGLVARWENKGRYYGIVL